jgi:hypothetical protein
MTSGVGVSAGGLYHLVVAVFTSRKVRREGGREGGREASGGIGE